MSERPPPKSSRPWNPPLTDPSSAAPEDPKHSNGHAADPHEGNVAGLFAEARRGSEKALGQLFEECRNYLLAVANRSLDGVLRQKLGGSDVVQETFAQAQKAFGRFEGTTRQEFLGWLTRILENRIRYAHRQHHLTVKRDVRRQHGMDDAVALNDPALVSTDLTPGREVAGREERERVLTALANLPEDQALAVRMRCWDRATYSQIAESLGRTEEAARAVWRRAILNLRELLAAR